jgi:hypothetical protein
VVKQTGSLTYARAFQNSVVLPDGRVFVAGGQSYPVPFSDAQSILAGEMWSPATQSFSTMAAASTPRNYHSVALLLQDGRVLSGGGGLCGDPCDNNHPNFEYYSPGYLFDPSGAPAVRPVIVSAPGTAGHPGDDLRYQRDQLRLDPDGRGYPWRRQRPTPDSIVHLRTVGNQLHRHDSGQLGHRHAGLLHAVRAQWGRGPQRGRDYSDRVAGGHAAGDLRPAARKGLRCQPEPGCFPPPPRNTILGRAPGGSHQRQDFK